MLKLASLVSVSLLFANYALAETAASFLKFQLQVDRYGPLIIGMTPKVASAKLGVRLLPASEPDKEEQSCYYVYPNGKFDDIGFMVQRGQITRIDIYSKAIPSIGSIRIGDSEDAIKRAFPVKVQEKIHPYIGADGKYIIIETKPGYAFVYETDRGKITRFRSGKFSSVQYIEGCL